MSKEIVLEVQNLSKRFKVYPRSWGRIREWLTLGRRSYHRDFWSLKDVSFKLHKGEFLGIIGPNWAGKSTLLRVITGVLDPTEGSYKVSGRVLSLLELNSGLDPSLTGRENIIRTTHLLGFPDDYPNERMEQIANFAELGDFFDQPMGTYSSGMRIRLAFSMFAFLDCDILILDEVLAVGDIFFKQKCYGRLEQLIKQDTAVLLVTQSTGVVSHFCDNVILMNKGKIVFHGAADQAVQKYFLIKNLDARVKAGELYIEEEYLPSSTDLQSPAQSLITDWPSESLFLKSPVPVSTDHGSVFLSRLLVCDEKGVPRQVFTQGEKACFYIEYLAKESIGIPVTELKITTEKNLVVHGKDSLQHHMQMPSKVEKGQMIQLRQTLKLDLRPGNYVFDICLYSLHPKDYRLLGALSPSELQEKKVVITRVKPAGMITIVPSNNSRSMGVHTGLCNLDGELTLSVINTVE